MPEHMQRRLVMLFCLRSQSETPLSDEELAFALRLSPVEVEETKSLFVAKRFIDESWSILNWEKRQFISDTSVHRMRRYRDRREAAGLTRGTDKMRDPDLYTRDRNRCVYCGSEEKLCIDHMVSAMYGGTDDWDNLAVACKSCNAGKGCKSPSEAGIKFLNLEALARHERCLAKLEKKSIEVEFSVTSPATLPVTSPLRPQIQIQSIYKPPIVPLGTNPKKQRTSKELFEQELTPQQREWFSAFWEIYPSTAGKPGAIRAFAQAIRTPEDYETCLATAGRYAEYCHSRQDYTPKHAQGWLNDERWRGGDGTGRKTALPFPVAVTPKPRPLSEELIP